MSPAQAHYLEVFGGNISRISMDNMKDKHAFGETMSVSMLAYVPRRKTMV